jgi:hypothetical protein
VSDVRENYTLENLLSDFQNLTSLTSQAKAANARVAELESALRETRTLAENLNKRVEWANSVTDVHNDIPLEISIGEWADGRTCGNVEVAGGFELDHLVGERQAEFYQPAGTSDKNNVHVKFTYLKPYGFNGTARFDTCDTQRGH